MIGASSYDFSPYRSNRNGLSPLKEGINENDGSTVTTPIEKLNAISSLYSSAAVPTSIAMARGGTGLNHALTSGKQKHSDLDHLMGEFNDLMSHLKVSVSPCRTAKKLPLTALLDPNEAETILERSHEFLHQTRMDNSSTHYTNLHADRTDTDYSSADDSASVATIRELSAQQLAASSAAETGAIQSRITTQMMNMYSKNHKIESSPSTTRYKLNSSQQNVPFSSYLPETSGNLERFTDYGPKITDSPLNSSSHQAESGMLRTGDRNHLDWRYDKDANDAERVRLQSDDDNIVTASLTHGAELEGLDEMIGKIDWEKRNAAFPHYFNALHKDEMRRRKEQHEIERVVPLKTRERGSDRGSNRGVNNNYRESNDLPNKVINGLPMYNDMPSIYPSTNGFIHGSGSIQRSSNDVEGREDKNRNNNNTEDTGYTPYTVSSRSLIHGDFRDSLEEEQGVNSFNGRSRPRDDLPVDPSSMAVINDQIPYTSDDRMTHNGQRSYYNTYQNNDHDHDFDQSSNRNSVVSQYNRQHRYDQQNESERVNEREKQHQHQEHSLGRYPDQFRRQKEVEEEKLLKEKKRDDSRGIEYAMRLRQKYDHHSLSEEQRGVSHVHGYDYDHISRVVDVPSSSSQRRSQADGMHVLSSDRYYTGGASSHRQGYGEVQLQQPSSSLSSLPSPTSSTTTTSSSSSPSTSSSPSSSSSTQYPILKSYGKPSGSNSVYDNPSLVVRSSKNSLSMPFMSHSFVPPRNINISSSSSSNNNNNINNNNNNSDDSHQMADINYWIEEIKREKEIIEENKRNGNRNENGYNDFKDSEINKEKVIRETQLQGAVEVNYEVKKKANSRNSRYVKYEDEEKYEGGESDNEDDDDEGEEGNSMSPPAPPSPLYPEDVNRMQVI